jgi:two-component system response regulator FixJ
VPLALEAIRGGAFDFIEKPFPDDLLIDSVRRALASAVVGGDEDEAADARRKIARLSDQERLVLVRIADGTLSKAIADDLAISGRALDVLRAKIMAKLEAAAFADLARTAMLGGLLDE